MFSLRARDKQTACAYFKRVRDSAVNDPDFSAHARQALSIIWLDVIRMFDNQIP
jgi:hypothetical protein